MIMNVEWKGGEELGVEEQEYMVLSENFMTETTRAITIGTLAIR